MSEFSDFDPEHLRPTNDAGEQSPDYNADLTICRGNGTESFDPDALQQYPKHDIVSAAHMEQAAGDCDAQLEHVPARDELPDLAEEYEPEKVDIIFPSDEEFTVPGLITEPAKLSDDVWRLIEEHIDTYVGGVQLAEKIYQNMEARYRQRLAAGEPISDRERDLMRSIGLGRLAISNVGPSVPFEQKSVNDIIAAYETMESDPIPVNIPLYRLMPGMLSYMRDEHGAQTMGDVATAIRCGDVPRGVVELWVEEGAVGVTSIDAAIVDAYPDLADKVQEALDRNMASTRRQREEFFGEAD